MVIPWRAGSPEMVAYCTSSVFPVPMVSISIVWELVFLTFSCVDVFVTKLVVS